MAEDQSSAGHEETRRLRGSSVGKRSGVELVSWSLLVVAIVVAVVVGRRAVRAPASARAADPLALVPPGARLVISADVASLTRVAAADLVRMGGDKLLGLRQTCGFEPLLAIERAVLALPEQAQPADRGSDFALIAATNLTPDPALRCAERVIASRGGKPSRTRLGDFTSVRDLVKPVGEVAMRADGMFVLSGGRYFRDIMDAAAGVVPPDPAATLRTQLHRSLRSKLGNGQLQLTFLPQADSLLRGVLAVGLALEIEHDISLRGLVACVSVAACQSARAVLERAKADLAAEPGLSGLSRVELVQAGDRLELAGRLPRQQLGALLEQLVTP